MLTKDEWEIIRKSADAAQAERDELRVLLNRARLFVPDAEPLQSEIRQALALSPFQRKQKQHDVE